MHNLLLIQLNLPREPLLGRRCQRRVLLPIFKEVVSFLTVLCFQEGHMSLSIVVTYGAPHRPYVHLLWIQHHTSSLKLCSHQYAVHTVCWKTLQCCKSCFPNHVLYVVQQHCSARDLTLFKQLALCFFPRFVLPDGVPKENHISVGFL